MSEQENKATVETAKKEKYYLKLHDHPEFPGDMKTAIFTSVQMADIVSGLFKVLPDYNGCRVCINDGHVPLLQNTLPYGALYVDLFFKDYGDDTDTNNKNIILRSKSVNDIDARTGRRDLGRRLARINGANSSRIYEVTPATYEMLEEFMRTGSRTRWQDHTQEISTPASVYGKEEVVVCISGLDLNRIITKIYGSKTKDGRYEYSAAPAIPIQNRGNGMEFVMQVCQLDVSVVTELQQTIGMYSSAPMYHAYNG